MTPEDWARHRPYDPHYDEPFPPDRDTDTPEDYGYPERILARLFVLLACLAIGIGIGLGLPR
jgi:hypothetical protein